MKKDRHALILELIDKYDVGTQEELLEKLLTVGVDVTQATVSRDIKELRLIKQPAPGGGYKYSQGVASEEKYMKYYAIFAESVTLVDYAQNICMLKCHPGTAPAACAAIDAIGMPEVLGTLAGDDTIFILCRSERAAQNTMKEIETLLKS
ncbi:MAG: arginine repressor [Clostridiales bacterium]|nr:arginine repressor [Clostridiales bacterium]MCD7828307.1 arginine repressor [Clostridiales bacterium]